MTPPPSPPSSPLRAAARIMSEFCAATGLHPEREEPRRYLWTDAFAVCNFVGLHACTGDETWLMRARELVEQVHDTLGRFRRDDPHDERRCTFLSADPRHPTAAGLRIGKRLAERREHEGFDERLEWERDGQYYHYLTKWMHALAATGRVTGDERYVRWAQELARGIHPRFIHVDGRPRGIYWKLSIDLSRPQVPAMGQHDPLDGYITLRHLDAALPPPRGLDLSAELSVLAGMLAGRDWVTSDPLGLGGLLCDTCRLLQLTDYTGDTVLRDLFGKLLGAAARGLENHVDAQHSLGTADRRLPFREFGLSIGLQAAREVRTALRGREAQIGPEVPGFLESIERHGSLGDEIHDFWGRPRNRRAPTWVDHEDINTVMWATSLCPQGFLDLHLGSGRDVA